VTGSFLGAMMGGEAFILLKGERMRRKSAKQAENRLAALLKILRIAGSEEQSLRAEDARGCSVVASALISSRYG
jgi:hypothetical protein